MARLSNFAQVKRYDRVARLCSGACSNLNLSAETDIIGPPDPISNLRPIIFARSPNETNLEKRYREVREATQLWNQDFWLRHNASFIEERKRFQDDLKLQGKELITADDMSVFYKQFLDKNWKTHLNYNVAWYRRNIQLLFLEIGVRVSKLKFK
ncbi:COA8 family protein CG14806, mitochondrial-like isoform X2 [Andrena cerasifolii]|uniref:COA8 family protein CG14806, mitochondrial-like isoform X2 n=1 Tax=Andrena cerasifolii TaxID=2819439 RepID=UPI00403826EA